MPARPAIDARPREPERGQALVEFAVVLLPLILVLVGILQFGFLFAAYVGVSNSAREAARAGTIYEYDANEGQGQNDLLRCQAILVAAQQSLDVGVPGQFAGTCAAVTGGGDLAIAYPDSGHVHGVIADRLPAQGDAHLPAADHRPARRLVPRDRQWHDQPPSPP